MSDLSWFDPVTPADGSTPLAVRRGATGVETLLAYAAGTMWRTGAPWTAVPPPPADGEFVVRTGYAGADGLVAVVAGTDNRVRVGPRAGAADWTDLGSPADVVLQSLAAAEIPADALTGDGPRLLTAAVDVMGALWVRLDADGPGVAAPDPAAWERVPTLDGTSASAVVALVVGRGVHLVTTLRSMTDFSTRFAVLIGGPGAWRWFDPGSPPEGATTDTGVVATVSGVGYAAFFGWRGGVAESVVVVLRGAGDAWTWTAIGRPPTEEEPTVAGVVGLAGTGGAAVGVVARTGEHLWLGGLDGTWRDLGRPDPDDLVLAVATHPGPPAVVVATGNGPRVWSIDVADPAPAWTALPALPSTVLDTVGGISLWDDPTVPDPGWHLFLVGGDGRLWARRWEGRTWVWTDHGFPAPGVTVLRGGGAPAPPVPATVRLVAVVGSDGALWLRQLAGPGWTWTSHGAPSADALLAAAAPVVVGGGTEVCALGGDGRVWIRAMSGGAGGAGRWDDRGTPPGTTVFAFVGAVLAPGPGGGAAGHVGFVIAQDGTLRASWLDQHGPHWVDLGAPAPGVGAAAGIGAVPVAVPGSAVTARVVVLDAGATRHLRVASWPPGPPWVDVAPPPGVTVRGTLGVIAVPDDPGAALAVVLGSDGHVWALRITDAGTAWSDWGAPPGVGAQRGRVAVASIEDHSPMQRTLPLVSTTGPDGSMRLGWPNG